MLQHPLPSNCKFYVQSHPQILDINSHLQILCYTNSAKERPISYKIDWRKRINGQFVPVTNVQGNTYTCGPNDLGAYINAEITSMDPIHSGTTVLEFGPVTSAMPLSTFSTQIAASLAQPVNQPPTFSGAPFNSMNFPPVSQSLPQVFAEAVQNFIPPPNIPVTSHTVFLLGNGAERQCDLKFTQHGMRIKDILTDYCYKFRVNRRGPRFEHNISEPTRVHITFDHKYVTDLSKFLRSFDDNRFVIILGDRGNGIIEIRFPTKQRKQTFMQACQSIVTQQTDKERVESAEVLFKTSVYEPLHANIDVQQQVARPSHPASGKISMTNYSNIKKEPAKKSRVDDYSEGSLLTWMDNILMKDKFMDIKRENIHRQNELRIQNHVIQKQLDAHRMRSNDRQREKIFNQAHVQNRRLDEQNNNIIQLSLALSEIKKQNQQLQHQNVRLSLNQQTSAYNFEQYESQLRIKEGVIADAYSELSKKEALISNLYIQNQKTNAILKQAQRKADNSMAELAELRVSQSRIKEYYSREIIELQQKIFAASERQREYQEQVRGVNFEAESLRFTKQVEDLNSQKIKYISEIKDKDNLLLLKSEQIEALKNNFATHAETQSILKAEIIELRHQLEQKDNLIVSSNSSRAAAQDKSASIELSKAKARILELQTLLKHRQSDNISPPTQIQVSPKLEQLLKEKQAEIANLQAQIQIFRIRQSPSNQGSHLVESHDDHSDILLLRSQYQNLMSIRNMSESRCEQLLFENYELKTVNQKLEFEIKFLQGQKQLPQTQEFRIELEKMSNHIDEQEQKYSKLDNEFEQFKIIAQKKEIFSLEQITKLEEKLKEYQNGMGNSVSSFAVGNMETVRKQNSFLVNQMQLLNKNCKKLKAQAEMVPKLTLQVAELRRKLLESSEQNFKLRAGNDKSQIFNIMDSSYKKPSSVIEIEESRKIAVSEILYE